MVNYNCEKCQSSKWTRESSCRRSTGTGRISFKLKKIAGKIMWKFAYTIHYWDIRIFFDETPKKSKSKFVSFFCKFWSVCCKFWCRHFCCSVFRSEFCVCCSNQSLGKIVIKAGRTWQNCVEMFWPTIFSAAGLIARNYIGTFRDRINRPINRLYECTHFVNRKAWNYSSSLECIANLSETLTAYSSFFSF